MQTLNGQPFCGADSAMDWHPVVKVEHYRLKNDSPHSFNT